MPTLSLIPTEEIQTSRPNFKLNFCSPGGSASVHAGVLSLGPVLEPGALHLIHRAPHRGLVHGARQAAAVEAAHGADPPVPVPAVDVAHGARAPRAAPPAVVAVQAAPVPAVRPARGLQRALRGLGEVLRGRGRVGVGGEGAMCAFAAAVVVVVVVVDGGALNFHAAAAGELGAFCAEGGRCARAGGGGDDEGRDEPGEMHISTIDLGIEGSQYLLGAMAEDEIKWENRT
ncbi:hypothetical protein BJ912DRAFT_485747 [Pholiota molesta]|nr:hypothetical protein BJ912DRAFT_485747 [Pholiota molesta]